MQHDQSPYERGNGHREIRREMKAEIRVMLLQVKVTQITSSPSPRKLGRRVFRTDPPSQT